MRRRGASDPVTPEVRAYVFRRDRACVVGLLALAGRIPDPGPCRDQWGHRLDVLRPDVRDLTAAHVRDRGRGGRTGARPPSTPRHLVAACYGHHLAVPVVDRSDVRDVLDDYLEEREGPEPEDARSWETVARVRGPEDRAREEVGGGA
jgi:hypothetical protein